MAEDPCYTMGNRVWEMGVTKWQKECPVLLNSFRSISKDKRNELRNSKAKQKGDATRKIVAKDLHELNKEMA